MNKNERIHLDKTDCLVVLEALKVYNQSVDRQTSYDLKCRCERIYSRIYQHYSKLYRSEKYD